MPAKKAATTKRKKAPAARKKTVAKKARVIKKVTRKKAASKKKAPARKKAASKKKPAAKKKAVSKKKPARKVSKKKAATKKKAAPRKKAASKKKPAAKKKGASKKRPATKKKAVSRKKPAPKKKAVSRKKPAPKKRAAARKPRGDVFTGPIHGIAPYKPRRGEEYMSDAQIEHFREILTAWKRELMYEVDRTVHHMQDEAANFPDPNDRATQESEFGLELRTALARLDDGSYGFCDETGEEIGLKRLEARPVATLCLEAQERRELAERQFRDRDDRYR